MKLRTATEQPEDESPPRFTADQLDWLERRYRRPHPSSFQDVIRDDGLYRLVWHAAQMSILDDLRVILMNQEE